MSQLLMLLIETNKIKILGILDRGASFMTGELKRAEVLLSEDTPKVLNFTLVTLVNGHHYPLFFGYGEGKNLRLHNLVNSG